jgi:predicted RNase H-like HicB family nuclease
MILDLIVIKTNDGYTAEVPSLNGVETWAHEEDEAITKAIDLLKFYLSLDDENEIKIDKARRGKNKTVYKIIFDKQN